MDDLIRRYAAIDALNSGKVKEDGMHLWRHERNETLDVAVELINTLPSAQPETATVTIGGTKGGVTMWYECDACGEPVDQKDCYCRKCGRRLKHE